MSVVDEVKVRLDIVDVVSGYVTLQKAGRNFKALCPFHQEKTPSFVVFPDTQTWRCFGACGEGGDVFSFVMKAEGWDFKDALRELANRAGVELAPPTPAQTERQAEAERLHDLLDAAARFFHEQLFEAPAAQIARDYVVERGLSAQTAQTFMLGYAPNDWRQALGHLQMLGYTQDDVIEAGVATRNDKGHVYDRFRHRLVIPIRDGRGRTVGFGARALEQDAVPKYLNSPQGPLFDKSHLLYGLDTARRAIRETEMVVIVEGYMDVMQAYQAGFQNIVAQMGTALTEHHLRQISRYASRLVLALDPDVAGITATMRGLDVARETLDGEEHVTFDPRGMIRYTGTMDVDIRVVSLPEGKDPDDLIRETPDAWQALIEDAVPVADFVIHQTTAHLSDRTSYHEREQIARELLPILTATESDIQRNGNIQTLARRMRIDERTLLQWAQHRQTAQTRPQLSVRQQQRLAGRAERAETRGGPPGHSVLRERDCLRMLLQEPTRLYAANRKLRELQGDDPALGNALARLNANDFRRADYGQIFLALEASLLQDELDLMTYLHHHLPPDLLGVVEELQHSPLELLDRALSGALATELHSILREQARIGALPEPGTDEFIQEALKLRRSRLEVEARELYFLQQDAQDNPLDDLTGWNYQATVSINAHARRLIAVTLDQFKSIARA